MKRLIVAVILLFIGTTAFSQELDLGIKGGANFSNIRNLKELNLEARTSFHAGVFVSLKFSGKLGLQADILYSEQGAKFRTVGNFDLNYVNIPVVLKYYLVDGQGFNVQVGPQFGILVNDNISAVVSGVERNVKANELDISGVIGFGYDFPYGIRADGRYHLGFTDVADYPQARAKHKYISVALGYSFL